MMIKPEHTSKWQEGSIDFADLLALYPQSSREDIATALGIPHAEYLVSVRHAHYWWPEVDEARIVEARAQYDSGAFEMATGRTKFYFYLYSFPREIPVSKRYYFTWSR